MSRPYDKDVGMATMIGDQGQLFGPGESQTRTSFVYKRASIFERLLITVSIWTCKQLIKLFFRTYWLVRGSCQVSRCVVFRCML